MSDSAASLSLGAGLDAARKVITAAIEAGELDGFIAGEFLERYRHEVAPTALKALAVQLIGRFEFTRGNVARLGVALACGWVAATPEAIARFVEGCERLERQQPDQAVDYRGSIKLLWGVALGARHTPVHSQRPDLAQRAAQALLTLLALSKSLRDSALSAGLLAVLVPEGRDERARALARRLLTTGTIDNDDVLATLWAISRGCFGGPGAITDEREELRALQEQLLPRALWIVPTDVIDALVADDVLGELARDLAARSSAKADALNLVLEVLDLIPELARRMRERKHGRPPFLMENEYDVQDLLYVTLKPPLPDLTDEEWTFKDAGGAKRIDLVSAAHRICIEAKKARNVDHAREIADELRVDFESYYVHPACDTLVVFVYDPTSLIADARKVEDDLSGPRTIKGRRVEVIVRIRPR